MILLTRKVKTTQSNHLQTIFRKNLGAISKKPSSNSTRMKEATNARCKFCSGSRNCLSLTRAPRDGEAGDMTRSDSVSSSRQTACGGPITSDGELLPERRTGTGTCLPRCKRHETRDRIILSILGARLFYVAGATGKQNSTEAVDDRPRIYANAFKTRAKFDSQSGTRAVIDV